MFFSSSLVSLLSNYLQAAYENQNTMNQPFQPIEKDAGGFPRFRENKIVSFLLKFAQARETGLNELAMMDFSREDRVQFAQLIGYSVSGFGELNYVSDDDYGAAVKMSEGKSAEEAQIEYLQGELSGIRESLKAPIARIFGLHPDDLGRNP